MYRHKSENKTRKGKQKMASPTKDFLKSRAAASKPVKLGQWHAGFSTVKKYAADNKVPLLAVWSNGDACGHCTHFEKVCMDKKFTTWMKSSGVAFWFGCSTDKTTDDKFEGTGFKFARNNKLTAYPFVRLWWPTGKVDIWKSGDDWTGGIKEGALSKCVDKFLKNLKTALKNYKPGCDNCVAPTPAPAPATPKTPVLAYKQDASCGGYALTVDGEVATCLTEAVAKQIVDTYNKGLK